MSADQPLEGRVALITGAARGQGRAHAVRLAEAGADIVAIDIAAPVESVPYDLASTDDLAETEKLVAAVGRRVHAVRADVRDQDALDAAVTAAIAEFGRLDVVVANAGVISYGYTWELPEQQWQDVIDINLTGIFHTVKATVPAMIAAGNGGAIVLTSSVLGFRGTTGASSYVATKHGVVGLTKSLANELGPHRIRVNSVNPSNVATEMVLNPTTLGLFRPDLEAPTPDDVKETMSAMHPMQIPWVEPVDVSNAILFLTSDDARYITGVSLPVDAGLLAR
ncbi:MAG: limC 3 [Pseudonocardiales bacterium]|nr:limC 3 [Pseudonocardiales bacterium]